MEIWALLAIVMVVAIVYQIYLDLRNRWLKTKKAPVTADGSAENPSHKAQAEEGGGGRPNRHVYLLNQLIQKSRQSMTPERYVEIVDQVRSENSNVQHSSGDDKDLLFSLLVIYHVYGETLPPDCRAMLSYCTSVALAESEEADQFAESVLGPPACRKGPPVRRKPWNTNDKGMIS